MSFLILSDTHTHTQVITMPVTDPTWTSPNRKHVSENFIRPIFGAVSMKRKADNTTEAMQDEESLYMVRLLCGVCMVRLIYGVCMVRLLCGVYMVRLLCGVYMVRLLCGVYGEVNMWCVYGEVNMWCVYGEVNM